MVLPSILYIVLCEVIKSENSWGFSIQLSDMGRQSESIGAKGLTNLYLVNTFQGSIQ